MKKSATKKKLAVQIAKDVLANIKAKKIIGSTGSYIGEKLVNAINYAADNSTNLVELKSVLNKTMTKGAGCEVCALGSMFVSLIDKKNSCKISDAYDLARDSEIFDNRLLTAFSNDELNIIETAFEGSGFDQCCFDSQENEQIARIAGMWGDEIENDTERLKAIMENIVKNKGEFILMRKVQAV